MVSNSILSWQINLMLSVQVIFRGLHDLKRILKELGLCANRDIQFMGSCLPLAGDDVNDGVLVEVGGSVVLLEGVVDLSGKRIILFERRGVTERRVLMCLSSSVDTPLSLLIPDLSW